MPIKKDNKTTSFDLFYSRIEFKNKLNEESKKYKNVVNFNFGEKLYYGRVNKNFVPITPDLNKLPLRATEKNPEVYLLNFVTRKVNDLSREFDLLGLKGILKADSKISSLKATRGYVDPNVLFSDHIELIIKTLKASLKVTPNFSSLEEFMIFIEPIIKKISVQIPVTYINFLKSKHCYVNCSGLAFEYMDLKLDNDKDKVEKVINDLNFPLIADLANKHGFMIDMFNPNRLVADLGSASMMNSYKISGYSNSSGLLNFGFQNQTINSFLIFKSLLLRLYNEIKRNDYIDSCGVKITPLSYKLKDLNKYDDSLVRLYLNLRQIEEKVTISIPTKINNLDSLLLRSEQVLCSPLDRPGSVGYKRRSSQARMDSDISDT
jgi:hypothetical protein